MESISTIYSTIMFKYNFEVVVLLHIMYLYILQRYNSTPVHFGY